MNLTLLCSNMILCICEYLDDTSYVHLFITSKRYFHLLRSEPFLRTLFRDRRPEGLTLSDLRRGLYNIIHYPTITYMGEKRLYNHYLGSYDNVLCDIFERVSLVRENDIYHSNIRAESMQIYNYQEWYVFLSRTNHLVLTNENLDIVDTIPNVDKCVVFNLNNGTLIYRQTRSAEDSSQRKKSDWYLYQPKQSILLEVVLSPHEIKAVLVTIPSGNAQKYEINFIIDTQRRLIHNNRVVARSVKEMVWVNEYSYYYLTMNRSLHRVIDKEDVLIADNIDDYLSFGPALLYYLSGGNLYQRVRNTVEMLNTNVEAMALVGNRDVVYYHKSSRSLVYPSYFRKIDENITFKSLSFLLQGEGQSFIVMSPPLL